MPHFLPSWFIVCNVLAMNTAEKLTKQQLNNQTPKHRNNDRNRLNSNKQDLVRVKVFNATFNKISVIS
jgi:hypothetical protein